MKNNKGFTIIELIGALIILGIITSMLAMLITSYISANSRIALSAKANTESAIVFRTIDTSIQNLNPNTYDTCPGNKCLILQKEYEYVFDENTNTVNLNVLSTPEEYILAITNNILTINDVPYTFEGLSLTDGSEIQFTETNSYLYITITLVLTDGTDKAYDYAFTYSYKLSAIPT